jgi:hypothetical protein
MRSQTLSPVLTQVDALINTVVVESPGVYHKLPWNVTPIEWTQTILPHIEARAQADKLLLQTLAYLSDVKAVFVKNIDTPEYRAELQGYHLYLTKGNVPGATIPPTYKSQHCASELARNLTILCGIGVKPEPQLNRSTSRQQFELVIKK